MKIFYSWQSDLDKKTNNYFVKEQIKKAIKRINRSLLLEERNENIELDHDTKGLSGSPQIDSSIFDKIKNSDIFICDVSIINSNTTESRKTPNPNVLIELGFAAATLGWDNIIMIANLEYTNIEELPFDIKGRRISTYELPTNFDNDQKTKQRKKLEQILFDAITLMLPKEEESKKTISIDGKIVITNLSYQGYSGIWRLKYQIILINQTGNNLEDFVVKLYKNDKPSKNFNSFPKMLYSGEPFIHNEIMPIADISKPIKIKLAFASKIIPFSFSEYKIQITEENNIELRGRGAGFKKDYGFNIIEKKENKSNL